MLDDVIIVKELAKKVMEIAKQPVQDERRNLWRKNNSLERVRPLIYIRAFAFDEVFDHGLLQCSDPFYRHYEKMLHEIIMRSTIGDDTIIEPWIMMDAVYHPTAQNRWGVPVGLGEKPNIGGAAAYKPVLNSEEDFHKLSFPTHKVNEKATKELYEKLQTAIGTELPVYVKRGTVFSMWTGDISTDLAKLRGLEQIMWDAYDRPEWLHKLLAFMRDGILNVQNEAEQMGDFSLLDHQNQAMPYALELKDPAPCYGVKRSELWGYMASQEFTTFGPEMFYEFLLQYQLPILEKYGLVAYGCCEDLTKKIDYLRKIPNLRRIGVSPFSNYQKCAEQIGKDYVLSFRPNPSDMISTGLDEDHVRSVMKENFRHFKTNDTVFDITLKDVETVAGQFGNVIQWVKIVREEIETAF